GRGKTSPCSHCSWGARAVADNSRRMAHHIPRAAVHRILARSTAVEAPPANLAAAAGNPTDRTARPALDDDDRAGPDRSPAGCPEREEVHTRLARKMAAAEALPRRTDRRRPASHHSGAATTTAPIHRRGVCRDPMESWDQS